MVSKTIFRKKKKPLKWLFLIGFSLFPAKNGSFLTIFQAQKLPDFPFHILPLTPSFVADAIAPAANNRYSVPYESSYPSLSQPQTLYIV